MLHIRFAVIPLPNQDIPGSSFYRTEGMPMPSTTHVRGWTVKSWFDRIIITKMCGDSCVAMQAEFRNNTVVVRAVQGPINVMPSVIANLGDLQAVVALCAAHPGWRSLPVVDEYGCPLV